MAVDINDVIANLKQSSGYQYGADNGYSSFTHLVEGNVGVIGDNLSDETALPSQPLDLIWLTRYLTGYQGSDNAPNIRKDGFVLNLKPDKRYCLVQYRIKHGKRINPHHNATVESSNYMYGYTLLSNDNTLGARFYYGYTFYPNIHEGDTAADLVDKKRIQNMGAASQSRTPYSLTFDGFLANVHTNNRVSLESKTYFDALNVELIGNKSDLVAYYGYDSDADLRFDGSINSAELLVKSVSMIKVNNQIPIFDISNYKSISTYLLDGEVINPEEESGLSPERPSVEPGFMLDSYTTAWDLYLSAGDGNGRLTITSYCSTAESLSDISKVKTIYSVDAPATNIFDAKNVISEKVYKSIFSMNLGDIAKNQNTDAWLDANNDPKGAHKLYSMLYSAGGHSLAISFEFTFRSENNIGVEIIPEYACKLYEQDANGIFIKTTSAFSEIEDGYQYLVDTGDVVRLHLKAYEKENDVYNNDTGNQYNPTTDSYGGSSGFIPQRGGGYYTYKLTYQQLKNVVNQFTSVTWTSVLASIFGGDLWKCLKSLKYTPIPYNGASSTSKLLIGGGTTQVGTADYIYINPTYVTSCGSISNIARKYNNFLDYNPYTQFLLHLPFTGYVDLPVDEIYNCTLKFELAIDYITGEGLWLISRNNCVRWTYTCNVAANVPLDGYSVADFAQGVVSHIGISGVAGLSLSTPVNIRDKQMKMETRSGYLNALDSMSIFYILEYPKAQLPTSAPHDTGRPCGLTKTLGSLKGFTKCKNVDVSGYSCTDAERNELISLLESGVYL